MVCGPYSFNFGDFKNMNKPKEDPRILFGISCMLLACSVSLYYMLGIFGYEFPVQEVAWSLPIAFFTWAISAKVDPIIYKNIWAFFGTMIFGSVVFTGFFLSQRLEQEERIRWNEQHKDVKHAQEIDGSGPRGP